MPIPTGVAHHYTLLTTINPTGSRCELNAIATNWGNELSALTARFGLIQHIDDNQLLEHNDDKCTHESDNKNDTVGMFSILTILYT